MNLPKTMQWATAYATEEFISVNTCSGLRGSARDPVGKEYFYSLDVSDEELGLGVVNALLASRFLSPSEVSFFFDLESLEKNYEIWVKTLLQKYSYKTRKLLFKNMKHCLIDRVDGIITIIPTKHEKIEAWGGTGISVDDYEIVNKNSSPIVLGKALKKCFEKCI